MAQQGDSYEEDDFWQMYTQAGMHVNPVTTGSMYPPITGPSLQPPVERTLSSSLPMTPGDLGPFASYGSPLPFQPSEYAEGPSIAQDSQAVYGTSAPLPSSEQLEDTFATHNFQGEGHSPASASESSLSTSSYTGGPSSRFSTTPAHIVPKERSPSDPRIPIDSIQTVEEARKSRRRAQNRAAQQAFKQRRKKREKELVKEVEQAEEHYKALEVEKKELEEELDRKKQERSSSITALSGRGESRREGQGQSRSSSQ